MTVRKKKICVVTGTRAEYGILYWLLKRLQTHEAFELQVLATGMHLSPEFGLTYRIIETDGFAIDAKVEMLLSGDTPGCVCKSMGLAMASLPDAFERLKPDWVVVLGDRYEILAAVIAAYMMKIPVVHIGGGETTEGALDEGIRHAISKMSYLHFTSTEIYRRRVIQLGEDPERVFNTGALGLDHLRRTSLLSRDELEEALDFKLGEENFLITYHPSTLGEDADQGFAALLEALGKFPRASMIFTYPNSDAGGRGIITAIDAFARQHAPRCKAFQSLGQLRYLSTLKHFDVVIGNSSSAIIEAPSFGTPSVNIGERQAGRVRAESVIDCPADEADIVAAIELVLSDDFRAFAQDAHNPYEGSGDAAGAICDILEKCEPAALDKKFHDIEVV